MRSRAVQFVLSALAASAVVGATFFIVNSERHIARARTAARSFDAVVRETTNSVAEFREDGAGKSIDSLRSIATTDKARAALDQAAAKADNFTEIAAVLDQVNAARMAEQDATDGIEAVQRRFEATALSAAAIVGLVAIAGILIATPRTAAEPDSTSAGPQPAEPAADSAPAPAGHITARPAGPVLRAASQLCTDLGRASGAEELRALVGRAADLIDASGLIIWMASADGSQLMPALSHGYAGDLLSKLPPLKKSADNAAARAYRTGELQIVLARPGISNGAVVAPILSMHGCVGVVSAELRQGGETSDSVQALAAIFAAQLAGVVHPARESRERATGT